MLPTRMALPERNEYRDSWPSNTSWEYQAFAVWDHTYPEIKRATEFR